MAKAGRRDQGGARFKSLADLRDEILRDDPGFRAAWEVLEPKRRVVAALLRLRAKANLTQKEVAERAGWSPAFVSRLESFPREGEKLHIPDLATLSAYAAACGCELGIVFGRADGNSGIEVDAATTLDASDRFHGAIDLLGRTPIEGRAASAKLGNPPAAGD